MSDGEHVQLPERYVKLVNSVQESNTKMVQTELDACVIDHFQVPAADVLLRFRFLRGEFGVECECSGEPSR
jgi:hypothetical protein